MRNFVTTLCPLHDVLFHLKKKKENQDNRLGFSDIFIPSLSGETLISSVDTDTVHLKRYEISHLAWLQYVIVYIERCFPPAGKTRDHKYAGRRPVPPRAVPNTVLLALPARSTSVRSRLEPFAVQHSSSSVVSEAAFSSRRADRVQHVRVAVQ